MAMNMANKIGQMFVTEGRTDKIGQSYSVISEMLKDRDILTDDEQKMLTNYSQKELDVLRSKKMFNIDIGNKVRIIYNLKRFQKAEIKTFIENAEFDLFMIILNEKLTTTNMKSITELEKQLEKPLNIEVFELKEVMFNITKHVLVPKHEVIRDQDKISKIVEDYNVKSVHHFPVILKTDPISKYYGIKPGNLVKVTRVSPSSGEYVVYRCCV
jgi:DNA-directed RNA polymerases I, II, and III subunit RPABC1